MQAPLERILGVLIALLVLASCAEQGSRDAVSGTISGGIVLVGGTATTDALRAARDPGTVILRQHERVVATQTIRRGQSFSFRLPAGSYQVTGKAPGFTCDGYVRLVRLNAHALNVVTAVTAVIRPRQKTNVEVRCDSKLGIG